MLVRLQGCGGDWLSLFVDRDVNSEHYCSLERLDMTIVTSPLFPNGEVRHVDSISSLSLNDRWQKEFGISLKGFWGEDFEIRKMQCVRSGLTFFLPDTAAGPYELYKQLQNLPWYYMDGKWEHRVAAADIPPKSKVLEVGCGTGSFIAKLVSNGHDALGIEVNIAAVDVAKSYARNVQHKTLKDVRSEYGEEFDVVCHFEVLEHVTDISSFVADCISCLKPGGKMLCAVPNMDSFVGQIQDNLLNMPPHHMSQWTVAAVASIADAFQLKLTHQKFEPLAPYHVDWYLGWKYRNNSARSPKSVLFKRVFSRLDRWILSSPIVRNRVIGHTQYACFEKPSK